MNQLELSASGLTLELTIEDQTLELSTLSQVLEIGEVITVGSDGNGTSQIATGDITCTSRDRYIGELDSTPRVITLAAAAMVTPLATVVIDDIGGADSGSPHTVAAAGSDLINGLASYTFYQGVVRIIRIDASNWRLV